MDKPTHNAAPTTIEEWVALGVESGWISEPYCGTHDMSPMTPEEEAEWDEGSDPCSTVIRVWTEGKPEVVNHGREGW